MNENQIEAEGMVILPSALTQVRAVELATLLNQKLHPFVELVECRSADNRETVVFDVEVERPRDMVHQIHKIERIAVTFSVEDDWYPEVQTLREDFPQTPHQNLREKEIPRSICLYEQPWTEVATRWTPARFIERIRFWLSETAKGTLHQEDQPLESLLFGNGYRIILPADLIEKIEADHAVHLDVILASDQEDCQNLIAQWPHERRQEPPIFLATVLIAKAQPHGLIHRSPTNLSELHDFLKPGGLDLLSDLRKKLRDWNKPGMRKACPIFIVALPLCRKKTSDIEAHDLWAFITTKTVEEVLVDLGVAGMAEGNMGWMLGDLDPEQRGQNIPIDVMAPHFNFSSAVAAKANGIEPDPRRVVAVGAGALGSQVISLLARSGFGTWSIVDQDDLLPHNLARYALDSLTLGRPKAFGVAAHLNRLYPQHVNFVPANITRPGKHKEKLTEIMSVADLILDMSASVSVSRHISRAEWPARRVSVFLNPQGSDLVVIAEDRERTLTLDQLEGQYNCATVRDSRLEGHLNANQGNLRYGRTCRDISTMIPNHLVTMHSAIATEAIRRAIATDEASIVVFRCDRETLAVNSVTIEITPSCENKIGDWKLVLNDAMLQKLVNLREGKLPNETGGVLLGSFDLREKVVRVVDTIPSPPDSKEWPTLYIRGSEGLRQEVEDVFARSGEQVEYVGEWHSHPNGCEIQPSEDDIKVFTWLTERMQVAGLPALMAIIGDGGCSNWFLGQISRTSGWQWKR